jgi:hypothetical protein
MLRSTGQRNTQPWPPPGHPRIGQEGAKVLALNFSIIAEPSGDDLHQDYEQNDKADDEWY